MSNDIDSWILVRVEDGEPFFEDAGGEWCKKSSGLEIIELEDVAND